jgi:hypothetical protein
MIDDGLAMDSIHVAMDGVEWNADLWDVVAGIVLATGRAPFRSPDDLEAPTDRTSAETS